MFTVDVKTVMFSYFMTNVLCTGVTLWIWLQYRRHFSGTASGRKIAGMIFDLTIPGGMGGLEAQAAIHRISPATPVFVSSGYSEDPVMAEPEKHGFTASISKPFRRNELAAMLNRFIKTENQA